MVGTLTHDDWTAEIFSVSPGEFNVKYHNPAGAVVEEAPLTGISTYKQREPEILKRLEQLCRGEKASSTPDLGDAGEY